MANYYIIGGDQKEYGPVTAAEMRQWISEGRLDAHSKARTESEPDWRPLSAFPEFSLLFQPKPPPALYPLHTAAPQVSDQEVKNPAMCLLVTGVLNVLLAFYSLVKALFFPQNVDQLMSQMPAMPDPQAQQMISSLMHMMTGPAAIALDGLSLLLSVIVLMGGVRMLALRNYEFVMVATILAMIPCVTPCCLLGLPFGIWAVIVLRRPGVKDRFH